MARHFRIGVNLLAIAALASSVAADRLSYPTSNRVDHTDDYHGTIVPDPYRWLEDDARKSQEVAEWVAAQNDVTFTYLKSIPQRESIQKRLTSLWNYAKFSAPFKVGGRYYLSKNDGLQNQFVLYMMDSLNSEPKILFDPNTWSEDGTIALAGNSFSDDGRYVAYGIAEAGSDWRKYRIREIATESDLPETLNWVKFTTAAWTTDGK